MIISRTPLRISFIGGGSDLESFYCRETGAVVSTTINKYIYITVNPKFDNNIRVSYSETEITEKVSTIKNELVREALKESHITGGIEITSISDVHSRGTGLGSSGAYTVGLLNALNAHKGRFSSAKYLASTAYNIERNKCGHHCGKQDAYATAYGGFCKYTFNTDNTVDINPIFVGSDTLMTFQTNLLLFYTGICRSSDAILSTQQNDIKNDATKKSDLKKMVTLTNDFTEAIYKKDLNTAGALLHENWKIKKTLSQDISNEKIDTWYNSAMKAGALGGKLLGAGGGGFLLFYAPKKSHNAVRDALEDLRHVKFQFEPFGSRIVFVDSR